VKSLPTRPPAWPLIANGFFHPFGDHAQASISLDNQPINDQYSKLFSNQLSLDAIQSMEVIAGAPPAEYGDKTSLVISASTRSGLGQTKPTGTFSTQYGFLRHFSREFHSGMGGAKWGNFLATNFTNSSSRFLDPPELTAFHDRGKGEGLFDRIDFKPGRQKHAPPQPICGTVLVFKTPNTYDQLASGAGPAPADPDAEHRTGLDNLFNSTTLLTFNPLLSASITSNTIRAVTPFSDTAGHPRARPPLGRLRGQG